MFTTIYSFMNKRVDLFIYLNILLLILLIVLSFDFKRIIKIIALYVFIFMNVFIVFISFERGIQFNKSEFTMLFLRVSTLVLMLFIISSKVSYKGILTALYKMRFPKALLELTAVSFLAIQILSKASGRIINSMLSRNLFSTIRTEIYATGVFAGVLFRKMLSDIKNLSIVAESRNIDTFYTLMVGEEKTNKVQVFSSLVFGSALLVIGVLLNG